MFNLLRVHITHFKVYQISTFKLIISVHVATLFFFFFLCALYVYIPFEQEEIYANKTHTPVNKVDYKPYTYKYDMYA